jgi:hypothetical protein
MEALDPTHRGQIARMVTFANFLEDGHGSVLLSASDQIRLCIALAVFASAQTLSGIAGSLCLSWRAPPDESNPARRPRTSRLHPELKEAVSNDPQSVSIYAKSLVPYRQCSAARTSRAPRLSTVNTRCFYQRLRNPWFLTSAFGGMSAFMVGRANRGPQA